jgi:mRNA interferase RelE/StbE
MAYELAFLESALKEWRKLGETVQAQFKKKLAERLEHSHVPSAALSGASDIYKIKLQQSGFRLVYRVKEQLVTVTVIAIGKRDKSRVYDLALKRLQSDQ